MSSVWQPSQFLANSALFSLQCSYAARALDRHASLTRDTSGPNARVINIIVAIVTTYNTK